MDLLASTCSGQGTPRYQYLLRLDDVGPADDPYVTAAFYLLRQTSDESWAVDASSLEDGVSLDRPRLRLAPGFVRAGTFWSVGAAKERMPLVLARECAGMTSVEVAALPLLVSVRLDGTAGRIGGVITRADADASALDLARSKAMCRLAESFGNSPKNLDLVAASVDAPNDGIPCDAYSTAMAFTATPTGAPASIVPHEPLDFQPSDICLSTSTSDPACPPGGCRTFGVDAEGRLAATLAELWPDRQPEPALPANAELAVACATLAACLPLDDLADHENVFAWDSIAAARRSFAAACAAPQTGGGSRRLLEEHAAPLRQATIRLGALIPAALTAKGDCRKILDARQPWPDLACDRTGCSASAGLGAVECSGTDAVFATKGLVRRCSESFATCSAKSPTGCTDRLVAACPEAALDRCDGRVLLGCNSSGRVTLRDCGRYGGDCFETLDGALCTFPYAECTALPHCEGNSLVLCTRGETLSVDCKASGFTGCKEGVCVH